MGTNTVLFCVDLQHFLVSDVATDKLRKKAIESNVFEALEYDLRKMLFHLLGNIATINNMSLPFSLPPTPIPLPTDI